VPRIPVALQLYSVREECTRDLPGTLKAVAEMGYEGVEFAGYYQRSAEELRRLLDDLGLKVAGTHTGLGTILGEELPRTVAFNQTLGNPNLIVPGLPPERRASREAWRETARLFDAVASAVEPQGLRVGYHNHAVEFQPLEGENPWDTFFGNTRPAVIMQLDTGNAALGGGDSVAILQKYPGRARTVHLKPYSWTLAQGDPHRGFRPVLGDGQDEMPWADIFRLCESTAGTEWYVVEYESDAFPPLEAVRRCREGLQALGK
jgi:sugar phosphate isomerase/epimerase